MSKQPDPLIFSNALTSQENILQSIRNLHYVFQSIFLGISFALIVAGFSILVYFHESKPTSDEHYLYKEPYLYDEQHFYIFLITCIAVTAYMLRRHANKLLKNYSVLILKRGLIVDTLEHLRLVDSYDEYSDWHLKFFTPQTAKATLPPEALFLLIKLLERIDVENLLESKFTPYPTTQNIYYLDCKRLLISILSRVTGRNEEKQEKAKKMHHFQLQNLYLNHYKSFQRLENESPKLMQKFAPTASAYIFYVFFCNSIYSFSYLNNLPREKKIKYISDSRKGHYLIINKVWKISQLLLLLLMTLMVMVALG